MGGNLTPAGTYPSHQRWFLPVSATLLRSYRCAVSQTKGTAQLPCGSGETQGEGMSLQFYLTNLSGLTTR